MALLSGQAKLDTGAAAVAVLVRSWATHAHVARVTPRASGRWEVDVPAGDYDITVIGPAGYQPVCAGPVSVREG